MRAGTDTNGPVRRYREDERAWLAREIQSLEGYRDPALLEDSLQEWRQVSPPWDQSE